MLCLKKKLPKVVLTLALNLRCGNFAPWGLTQGTQPESCGLSALEAEQHTKARSCGVLYSGKKLLKVVLTLALNLWGGNFALWGLTHGTQPELSKTQKLGVLACCTQGKNYLK